MPSLLDDPYPARAGLLGLDAPNITPPDERTVSQGDALAQLYTSVMDKVERERRISAERGLWDDETGRPTTKGLLDAAHQYSESILAGTTAPAAKPGLSLEQVGNWKTGHVRPLDNHTFLIKHPEGEYVGSLDTTWDPATGHLHIADISGDAGPNSFGPGVIRQLRDTLLEQYPGTKMISGERISGAGAGRWATQKISDNQ